MRRYRYVTPALYGPWRESREEALADAVRARQARPDPDEQDRIVLVDGTRIEESER